MFIPFLTTPEPGRRDAPMVLSRSRWVICDLGLFTFGGSAHAARSVREAIKTQDFLIPV
jgi:hypothetical protein